MFQGYLTEKKSVVVLAHTTAIIELSCLIDIFAIVLFSFVAPILELSI